MIAVWAMCLASGRNRRHYSENDALLATGWHHPPWTSAEPRNSYGTPCRKHGTTAFIRIVNSR